MPTTKTLYGHKLVDLVPEDQLFLAADLNGIGITDALVSGVVLALPERIVTRLQDERLPKAVKPILVKALNGQAWIDLTLQELGDESRLFEMVDLNGGSITGEITPGTIIQSPEAESGKKRITNLLQVKQPASSRAAVIPPPKEEGIEFWAIEYDFIVS
ncbi:MAG: hypothetical protein HOP30_21675 [Cyclobacteriaceae bacterium]|nr:hypothetical protein [Cyclobacteriaceae bacterium]